MKHLFKVNIIEVELKASFMSFCFSFARHVMKLIRTFELCSYCSLCNDDVFVSFFIILTCPCNVDPLHPIFIK